MLARLSAWRTASTGVDLDVTDFFLEGIAHPQSDCSNDVIEQIANQLMA
jgi:hypothetical protein